MFYSQFFLTQCDVDFCNSIEISEMEKKSFSAFDLKKIKESKKFL